MAQKLLNDPGVMETGRYRVRLARGDRDLARALALRARLFRGDVTVAEGDGFDPLCRHLMVETRAEGALVCTCRMLDHAHGGRIEESYSAQFYDLGALGRYAGRMVEIGRFCIAPEANDADVLRLAWATIARLVLADEVGFLFGCTSFRGTDAAAHAEAFALLAARYLAPEAWRPGEKAPDVFRYARTRGAAPDVKRALNGMPPLLRSYLAMGGRVSDHAVRDTDLGTLHVFTGLEVARVPTRRRQALLSLAGE